MKLEFKVNIVKLLLRFIRRIKIDIQIFTNFLFAKVVSKLLTLYKRAKTVKILFGIKMNQTATDTGFYWHHQR